MSFFDNPEIDLSSEASEESVHATRQFFCQRNGFLTREEIPDKGVDLDVELIVDKQVSGFKFAIQVKSVQKLEKVKKESKEYVRYSFKTSRLGYLCRRTPGVGIIIVYDDENKLLYYDYVEKIYNRIMDEHNGDSWKNNKTVTIHVDENNVLTAKSAESIYEVMKRRYANFVSMYSWKAYDFDLPTFNKNELRDPIRVLEKYGYVFFNKKEYQILFGFFSNLEMHKIITNHKLLLLAAITYYEIGYYIEGDYFAKKCNSYLDKYSDEEKELLSISKLSADFYYGVIDRDTYLEALNGAKSSTKGIMNSVLIRLKILFFELFLYHKKSDHFFEHIFKEITSIWTAILDCDIDEESRQYFLLEIVSCIHEIGILTFIRSVTYLEIQRKTIGEPPLQDKLNAARLLAIMLAKPQQLLSTIWDYASKAKNEYLQAVILYKKNYMFYSFLLQNTFFAFSQENGLAQLKTTTEKKLFSIAYNELISAHNIFHKRMDLSHAYNALTLSMEVNYLYSILFSGNIDNSRFEQINNVLNNLEKQLNRARYEILTDSLLKNMMSRAQDDFDSLPEEEIPRFADMVIESLGIPKDRLENVIFDISFLRQAERRINNKYFELLQNLTHTKDKETMYKEKPGYVIKCKKCGYQTDESSDLDELLNQLAIDHGYVCL